MTKKFIFIPVVNNFDLLEKAINSVPDGIFDDYFVFNNSNEKIPINLKQFKVIDRFGRLTFKQTQNCMREYAINNNYDYYCFMHNDGEVVDDTTERLIKKADELIENNEKWSIIFTNYDVLCAYSTDCVKHIGKWGDSHWPVNQQSGYYLDNDYYRRMGLTHYKIHYLQNTNVLHNNGASNTIKDQKELISWDNIREQVINHYIKKWDGGTNNEKLKIPLYSGFY